MALKTGDNFLYQGRKPLDSRDSFDTILAMTSFAVSSLDDGHISYCKETEKHYEFKSTNDFDTQLGYWREYNGGGSGSSADEKVKLNNTSESKYLEELIDNSTIEVDVENGVIKAVSLDGLETTVATLNFVKNLDKDIMTYLSSIGNPMAFKGVVADDDALNALTDMVSGDTYIVQSSASNSDKTMTFIYNGVSFVAMAETSIEVRDFTTDPIDLSTETTGTLHKSKIDSAIARLADVLDKSTYKGSADGVVKYADALVGLTATVSQLAEAVTSSHKHANKTVLDKIVSNGIGEGFLSDMGTYVSFLHIGTTSPTYDSQLWVDNTDSSAPILKIYDGIDWVEVSSSSKDTIIVDTAMSGTSTNVVQNNVIKKYVDSKVVEVSATTDNAIETKTDGIYVKKTAVSTDSDNALSEKSNGLYVKDLSGELDKINYAQKTVNEELDYCYITDSSYGITATCAANDNLVKLLDTRDTNMEIDSDSYIKLCANKRYSISCDFLTKSAVSVYIQDKEGNQYANRGYISGGTYSGSSPSLIIEPKTDIYIGFIPVSSFAIIPDCSYISIYEIGRAVTIDPLEYVNESEGIEDTPVGHIMACMSNSAPKHYLICDGTEYNIVDYPYLAEHFKTEFGKVNYFGGDGSTTFATPDLRGEFLRSTGTNSHANQGSGAAVGKHQDATEHPSIGITATSATAGSTVTGGEIYLPNIVDETVGSYTVAPILNTNPDSQKRRNVSTARGAYTEGTTNARIKFDGVYTQNMDAQGAYTSRPTNTSVLYCIKYEPTFYMQNTYNGNVYSTEEKVVGKWIDGKSIYQKTFAYDTLPVSTSFTNIGELPDVDTVIDIKHIYSIAGGNTQCTDGIIASDDGYRLQFVYDSGSLAYYAGAKLTGSEALTNIYVTVQYTKTTDSSSNTTVVPSSGSCDCVTYTDDEVATEIDTVLEG